MKKLLLFAAVLTLQVELYGQAVPNGTFENWSSIAYDDPNGWTSGNSRDIPRLGGPSVTKVAGFTGFAVRIQNNIVGTDTSDSYIINTNNPCSDPSQWTGGVPFTQQPTAITGYCRYNLLIGDTAIMFVIFRKNGVHIGDNFIQIRGTGSQSTFAPFSFSVTCTGIPDTMIIAAATKNKNAGMHNGSFIEFDNLAFAGTTQIIPNGDFENWTAKSYDVAGGWVSWGNATKTTSMYAGNYAVRLETMNDMCGGSNVNSSGITTGHMTNNSGPAGGVHYTSTKDTLCGFYKYTSLGRQDTAGVYVSLSKSGTGIGGNYKQLVDTASYTAFSVIFQSSIAPDTIRIDAQSSHWPATASNVGSVLYLDNLYLKSAPLKVFEIGNVSQSAVYPNPVKDILFIRFEKNFTGSVNVNIYDATGRKVEANDFSVNINSLRADISSLQSGIYFLEIKTAEGILRNRFVKE